MDINKVLTELEKSKRRVKLLESQLLCIDQAVRKNDWTTALENCMTARATISIAEVKSKAVKEFKEELFKSLSIMYRPHVEGVIAVIEQRNCTEQDA